MEIVGQRLKALRESMGISQAKIALLLDSKQPNINRFEHNQSEPPLALLCRYADFFDVSLDISSDAPISRRESYTNTSQPILLNGRTCGALSRCALILRRLQMPS